MALHLQYYFRYMYFLTIHPPGIHYTQREYPHISAGALYSDTIRSASANPQLNFTVVVNPGNGPGNESIPDTGYRTAIEKLHTYANIEIVGYVHTSWTSRNISLVLDDIATYSGWTANDPDLVISGIFFDETPTVYSSAASEYLESINAAVKSSSGIRSPKTVRSSCRH